MNSFNTNALSFQANLEKVWMYIRAKMTSKHYDDILWIILSAYSSISAVLSALTTFILCISAYLSNDNVTSIRTHYSGIHMCLYNDWANTDVVNF